MKQELSLLLSAAIETGFKRITTLAADKYHRQYKLHGEVLCIELEQLSWPIYLIFAKDIQVLSHYEGDVTTKVKADITTLYQLTEGANLTELIKQDKLALEGDLQLLQNFSHFMQNLDIDIAEPISRYIGDAPTHMLQSKVEQSVTNLKSIAIKTKAHISQLTTEEYKLAPHRLEYIHFKDQLDELNTDIEHIEQRINKLLLKAKT